MNRKRIWIAALSFLILAGASAVALADFGGSGGSQDVTIIGPPHGGDCNCPAIWAPVMCTAQDGSRTAYSNQCVANCYGNSSANCAILAIQPRP